MAQHADLAESSVGQIMIPVENLDRAIAFYRDTLGCRFLFTAPPQMSFFQTANVRLLIGVPEKAEQRQHGSIVYFKVADIQAVFQTLSARGVPFGGKPHLVHKTPTSELWLAEFRDPDGNGLALMSEVAVGG
jgi:methylmalonyl-CoA/ethylmalonyl-CoA epimerase